MQTMNNNVLNIAVIGGGASGMVAAISASREAEKRGKRVKITIYEANQRIGKKILVTGNGRCNFTNDNISENNFHGEKELAMKVYSRFDNESTKDFFASLGLLSKSDFAGRVYPMSFQATSVLDVLRYELIKRDIETVTETKITSVEKSRDGFVLNGKLHTDVCIIASGGKAAPVQGSDGSGFELLKRHGISIETPEPALTPLICENFTKALKGIRAQGKITIKCAGKILREDIGEIQYTDYGLSGIPSMQVSRFAARALKESRGDVLAFVDACPYLSPYELKSFILSQVKNNPKLPSEMLLSGIMPKRLAVTLLADCSVSASMEIGKIFPAVADKIVSAVKYKKYKINSVKGFNDAQVTSGGIKGDEIDYDTLGLRKLKGAYVCGEIINIDGDCGGYNLQWAWSSGYVAGINAVREN